MKTEQKLFADFPRSLKWIHSPALSGTRVVSARPLPSTRQPGRNAAVVVRADRESGSFWSGFVLGGVVFGVLGFVFAPQISHALLGEDQCLRLPRFLEEEEETDPEVTRANLAEKIAQLNSAIDEVSSQLKSQDYARDEVAAN